MFYLISIPVIEPSFFLYNSDIPSLKEVMEAMRAPKSLVTRKLVLKGSITGWSDPDKIKVKEGEGGWWVH